jgi:hypothetical protein
MDCYPNHPNNLRLAESVGDQFMCTNIVPSGMSVVQLYEGYSHLLERLYSYRSYRKRAMQLILSEGAQVKTQLATGSGHHDLFPGVMNLCS